MGFLYALILMCAWMLYGGTQFYMNTCNITYDEGKFNHIHVESKTFLLRSFRISPTGPVNSMLAIGGCNPWIGWILVNALLHLCWVTLLTVCQTYQIVWLGMTTNERMNRGRYRHFQATGGKSPFNRGPIRNTADFLECNCFGAVQPVTTDWMTYFELEKRIEHEPLLRATDNYQYV